MANTPEAYIEKPVAVLYGNQVWSIEGFTRRIHPSHPDPIPAELTTVVRLMPTPCRPCGHDGCTISRKALPC